MVRKGMVMNQNFRLVKLGSQREFEIIKSIGKGLFGSLIIFPDMLLLFGCLFGVVLRLKTDLRVGICCVFSVQLYPILMITFFSSVYTQQKCGIRFVG